MHIAAALISPDLRITAANQSMGAVIGCDCSELDEQPFLACFHPEDVAHAARTMRHLQQQHFSHRQQGAAQEQIAAHAAAMQAAAAQSIDGLITPPPPLEQHQIPPLQTWEVLTLRISRRVSAATGNTIAKFDLAVLATVTACFLACAPVVPLATPNACAPPRGFVGSVDGASELSNLASSRRARTRPSRVFFLDRRQARVQATRFLDSHHLGKLSF